VDDETANCVSISPTNEGTGKDDDGTKTETIELGGSAEEVTG
jgi:hypothetical protein